MAAGPGLGLDSLAEALAAGVGGVVCTIVLYPLEIVKSAQSRAAGGPGKAAAAAELAAAAVRKVRDELDRAPDEEVMGQLRCHQLAA